jgi:type VI secretion system protein ImpE
MDAGVLLREGRLAEALKQLETEVRAKPTDAKLRVFLFQLLCVQGKYERALTQLNVSSDLDPGSLLMAQVCGPALAAENLRGEIFAGRRSPLLLGEPEEWIGWLLQANKHLAEGQYAAAVELRDKAFEAAPATSGTLNGQPFEWIADADQRFGPILEAVVDGKYYWIPFHRLKEIAMEAPSDLRDLVWMPAILTLTTGTPKVALLPVRYPGTVETGDELALLSRKTDWADKGGLAMGVGQRILATDVAETPLLEVRKITLNSAETTSSAPPASVAAET